MLALTARLAETKEGASKEVVAAVETRMATVAYVVANMVCAMRTLYVLV